MRGLGEQVRRAGRASSLGDQVGPGDRARRLGDGEQKQKLNLQKAKRNKMVSKKRKWFAQGQNRFHKA